MMDSTRPPHVQELVAASDPTTTIKTSAWNQVAPRHYMTVVLCFPVDEDNIGRRRDVTRHIQQSLERLAVKRPDFARRLLPEPGSSSRLCVQEASCKPFIPMEEMHFAFTFRTSFTELKKKDYPAEAFVNPGFIIKDDLDDISSNTVPLPVFRIRLLYIEGGLLMFVYMHHTYGDGSCMDNFLTCLSVETILCPIPDPAATTKIKVDFNLGSNEARIQDPNQLITRCPEYTLLTKPYGPTQLALKLGRLDTASWRRTMTGKTFVISSGKLQPVLQWLTDALGKRVSSFLAIRALIWAHTTKARYATEPSVAAIFANRKPNFTNPHDWHNKKLFPDNESLKHYFGNGVAIASCTLDSADILLDACGWKQAQEAGTTPSALLEVIRAIDHANSIIDEDFVLTRTALFNAMPDIRYLGVAHDARAPHTFSCNTWKFLGSNARFCLPGDKCCTEGPDREVIHGAPAAAIRRVQGEWAFPHALVLPDRPGLAGGNFELLVTLPKESMHALERDEDWMTLVVADPGKELVDGLGLMGGSRPLRMT